MENDLQAEIQHYKKITFTSINLIFYPFFLYRDVGIDGDSLMVYALVSMSDGK